MGGSSSYDLPPKKSTYSIKYLVPRVVSYEIQLLSRAKREERQKRRNEERRGDHAGQDSPVPEGGTS